MIHHTAPTDPPLPAPSVWTGLTAQRRADVLRLLTQLVYTYITTPLKNSQKESNDAVSSPNRQDRPRSS
jgi:hypothetical protein